MEDARVLMREALSIMDVNEDKQRKTEEIAESQRQKSDSALRKERRHSSRCKERQKKKHKSELDKLGKEHKKLIGVQARLAGEVKSWKTQYEELLVQSESDVKAEREI